MNKIKNLRADESFRTFAITCIAVVLGALLAHLQIPLLAILGAFALTTALNCYIGYEKDTPLKRKLIDLFSMLVGSQIGWVALLI